MSKKFSLVYWTKSKNIQTVESNKIPAASRYEGATVKLKFQENKNKARYLDAKVIEMSNDEKELNELEVDEETGEIIDRSRKAFSNKVLATRVSLLEEKKACEKRTKAVNKTREEDIINSKSFLTVDKEPRSKKMKSSQAKKDSTPLKNISKEDKEKIDTPINIPSTSFSNDKTGIEKSKITEVDSSFDAKDDEDEEIMESVSAKKFCFIPGVTAEVLAFHKYIVASMEYSLDPGREDVIQKITKLTKEILTYSREKIEIFPNTGCYIRKSIMASIDIINSKDNDWRKHLTHILVQMFGDKLKFMSAKGTRGNIALHPKIWRALFNLINDKTETQIPSTTFNIAINKACSNRKTNFTKTCVTIEEKKEYEDVEDVENSDNLDTDFLSLSNHQDLPRSLSSSPRLDHSRTSSPVTVEDQEKADELLVNDIEIIPNEDQTTVGVKSSSIEIPLNNDTVEQSTITLICSKSFVERQSTVTSAITPAHSKSHVQNQSTITPGNSNSYPQHQSTVASTIIPAHSNSYFHNQSTITPTVTPGNSNSYPQHQSTVASTIIPAHSNSYFHNQSTITPTVTPGNSNSYPQHQSTVASTIIPAHSNSYFHNQSTITPTVTPGNSNSYPQHQSTVASTIIPAHSNSYFHNQSTITPTVTPGNSNSYPQHQSTVASTIIPAHSNSYFHNQSTITPTVTPGNSNSYPQHQSTVASTIIPAHSNSYFHNQSTITPAVSSTYSNPYPQQQSTVTSTITPAYFNSYGQNQYQPTVTPMPNSHPSFYNQAPYATGLNQPHYGGPQWYSNQPNYFSSNQNTNQNEYHRHPQSFNCNDQNQ